MNYKKNRNKLKVTFIKNYKHLIVWLVTISQKPSQGIGIFRFYLNAFIFRERNLDFFYFSYNFTTLRLGLSPGSCLTSFYGTPCIIHTFYDKLYKIIWNSCTVFSILRGVTFICIIMLVSSHVIFSIKIKMTYITWVRS